MPLTNYEVAAALAPAMIGAIERGEMPPWLAHETDDCQPPHGFQDDLRVPEAELDVLKRWAELGAAEGDGAPDSGASASVIAIDAPTKRLAFRQPYVVDGDRDDFQCFVLDPEIDEKVWVTEVQLTAGNERVAHHGLVVADLTGETEALADAGGRFDCFNPPDLSAGYLMMTWTPGGVPNRTPTGTGMLLVPGSRLVVQMHYHPTGSPEEDQSSVELKWITREPEQEAAQALVGNFHRVRSDGTGLMADGDDEEFRIPAGAANHVERMVYRHESPFALPLFAVGTHMHYAGTSMRIELQRADGTKTCLLETPKWDFDWQRTYSYDAPRSELPTLEAGDELHLRCSYDNSMANPGIRAALEEQGLDAPVDIALGDETLDEMCLGMFGLLVPPGLVELGL